MLGDAMDCGESCWSPARRPAMNIKESNKKTRTGRGVEGRPGRRSELRDEAWERIGSLLPTQGRRTITGPRHRHVPDPQQRRSVARHACAVGQMEACLRPVSTLDTRKGVFDRILRRLHGQLDQEGPIGRSVFDIDGSNIRTIRSAQGATRQAQGPSSECGRAVHRLTYCRRVAERYEKLAMPFLAMVRLAMVRRCLRPLDPSDRT